jgi:hypothetical protein
MWIRIRIRIRNTALKDIGHHVKARSYYSFEMSWVYYCTVRALKSE